MNDSYILRNSVRFEYLPSIARLLIFKIKADEPIVTKPNMCEGWLDNISYSPNKFGFEALDLKKKKIFLKNDKIF